MPDSKIETLEELMKRYKRDGKDVEFKIGVAVDGSLVSHKAFELGVHIRQLKESHEMKVLHVSSSSKTYLPKHLQPSHLKSEYMTKAIEYQIDGPTTEWIRAERGEHESTCLALTNLAQEEHVQLLIVGSFGRKGEKLDMLGSVSDFSLRTCNSHVAVVKSSSYEIPESSTFILATDFSQSANFAFLVTVFHLMGPKDVLKVVAIQSDLRGDAGTKAKDALTKDSLASIEKIMKDMGIQGTTEIHTLTDRSQSIAEGILEKVAAWQVDNIVMGICGHDHRDVGSVTENILQHARCTVFAIKNPYTAAKSQIIGNASLAQETVPHEARGLHDIRASLSIMRATRESMRTTRESFAG